MPSIESKLIFVNSTLVKIISAQGIINFDIILKIINYFGVVDQNGLEKWQNLWHACPVIKPYISMQTCRNGFKKIAVINPFIIISLDKIWQLLMPLNIHTNYKPT